MAARTYLVTVSMGVRRWPRRTGEIQADSFDDAQGQALVCLREVRRLSHLGDRWSHWSLRAAADRGRAPRLVATGTIDGTDWVNPYYRHRA